ncbi:MAG: 16S rRNA (cytosine(1402)-N(4))-methyltransferase RsmH [bacterium]|nr:16S rRNA (cytosine(1402)-N(4))-methyltransferase RsmH [bacterium]
MNTAPASAFHVPVLAAQAVDMLVTDPEAVYVDLTVGGGGHSVLILRRLGARGRLIGCDRDGDALFQARTALPHAVSLFQCRFSEAEPPLRPLVADGAAGVLMDLGVSSHQLDTPERGFSHRYAGPLDLRMDQSRGETAAQLLARLSADELIRLIWDYGEDPQARRIARAVVAARLRETIETTEALAHVISHSVAATRTKSLARVFQALRIAVNDELSELSRGLETAWHLLRPDGRLVVITYHSLEDRITKTFMKALAAPVRDARDPFAEDQPPCGRLLLRKPLTPDDDEVARNPRARSAKLRAIEKMK